MFVFWSVFLGLLAITYFLIYKYVTRNFSFWKNRKIFYIKPTPFFGNLLPVFTMKTTIGDLIMDFYKRTEDDYFGMFVLDRPVLVVRSPKLAKNIMLKDFASFHNRVITTSDKDPILSNMLFFNKRSMWKVIRAKLTPVFTSGKLKAMLPVIIQESEALKSYIDGKLLGVPNVETKEVCGKYSTNLIALTAFGVDAKCFENENAEFRAIGKAIWETSFSNAVRQLGSNFFPGLINTFGISFVSGKLIKQMKSIINSVINTRNQLNQNKGNDLIDILRGMDGANMSNDMILAQAVQFFVAGFDTISSTMSFTLYELAMNQDIQDKLRLEIKENLEANHGVTYDGYNEIKYLDMVISEALRKYPVLPFLERECTSTYKFEGTDLVVEKGQAVYISTFGMQYDEKYFPDPERFDPERFCDKNEINKEGFYFTPFGEGPRICIGNRYGLMAVKVGLIAILSRFRVIRSSKTPEKITFEPKSFLVQASGGIPLQFAPL
nr:Cytochrome P450 [Sitophilus oryzae]